MDGVHTASSVAAANSVPPFLSKTYDMVDDQSTNSLVSWSDNNNSFVVRNVPEFAKDLLPKYFKHNNFSSFVRQLNTYGFRKVDPDRWEFANEAFLRGQKHLLKSITRRKQPHLNNYQQQTQTQNPSSGSCIEVGKFGLEEEVEILKRDKNVLMQELVKLRQQQQSTDHQLQNVGQRVQIMEQRQQKMMSFLAKAVQSPGFLAQIVQQQNENNRHFTGGNKKRRLPRQEEDTVSSELGNHAPDGRIVKYLPSMNEAAKTLLRQILQMNTSPRRESSVKNPDAFLIDGVPSSHTLDNRSSPIRSSGVTLSEVPPSSGQSYMDMDGEFPMNFPSNGISERQSSTNALSDSVKTAQFLELNSSNDQNTILPDLCGEQRLMSECNSVNPDLDFVGSESDDGGNLESMSAILDGTLGLENDDFSGVENMMLPGINDVIWEYFHDVPFDEDRDEVTSISIGSDLTKEQELSEKKREQGKMSKIQNLDHITEKMGILASEGRRG